MEMVCQRHFPAVYPRERETLAIVQEAGWAPGPFWKNAGKLAPTEIRSPELPVSNE